MKSTIISALFAAVVTVNGIPMPMPTPVSSSSLVHGPPLTQVQPGIPSASTAVTQLSSLTVKAYSDDGNYDRDLFPTWNTIEGSCNTR
jgi:hypothetical protein